MRHGTAVRWMVAVALVVAACKSGSSPTQPQNRSPTANIAAPANGASFTEGQTITFQGSANDPEDGALTGASLVWRSDRQGQIGTGTAFTRDNLSVGAHRITLTATDGDGATGSASIDLTVQPATGNQLPIATITSPADNATFDLGETITFQGSANDPEDGALTGASLVWQSSVDGQIGTGTSFTRDDLSAGNHTITLTATDNDGGVGTATRSITVRAAGPGQTVDMTIEDDAFVDPQNRRNAQASVTITLGDRVRWTYLANQTSSHTVTSGVGPLGSQGSGVPAGGTPIDSPLLQPGQEFVFEPDAVGTWTYYCQVHPNIMFNATIIVQAQ